MIRVRVLQAIRTLPAEHPESHVVDEEMQDLAVEDDDVEQKLPPGTPVKVRGRRKRDGQASPASAMAEQAPGRVARPVDMPSQPAVSDCTVEVLVALEENKCGSH